MYPYLHKSLVKVRKYSYLPLNKVLIRTHTYECIYPNKSSTLSPYLVNDDLDILPSKQDLHTSYDSKSNKSNGSSI